MTATNIKEIEKIVTNAEYYRQKIGVKKKNPAELKKLFAEINQTLEEMAKSANMTVDELIEILDPSNPFPF